MFDDVGRPEPEPVPAVSEVETLLGFQLTGNNSPIGNHR